MTATQEPGRTSAVWTEPFTDSAYLYDALYARRDYAGQAERLTARIRAVVPGARSLLDVACGTGLHLQYLRRDFDCEGVDRSSAMLRLARRRNPLTPFHLGDMRAFRTGGTYDAVTCLFSSITYALDPRGLGRAARTFAEHLRPGGVCLVEPFIPWEAWVDEATGHTRVSDEPDLTVAMVDRATRTGRTVVREVAYCAATPVGLTQLLEQHVFGLFTAAEYRGAFAHAGFDVDFDEGCDWSRGLYIARLP